MDCSMLGFPVLSLSPTVLLKLMFTELVMPSTPLILCRPPSLPTSIFPSIRVFSRWKRWVGSLYQMAKVLEFEHQFFQWIFRIYFLSDWLVDLLAVQRTLKSLLQQSSSKVSLLQHSAFFMVQLSYVYMTTGKTVALTIWTFVGKMMPLLFNALFAFVIAFFLRNGIF